MFWHTARDDTMYTFMRCISRNEKTQHVQATKGTGLKSKTKVAKPNKKKQPAKKTKAKGLAVLSEVALTEAKKLRWLPREARKTFTYHMQLAHVMELTLSQRFLMSNNKRLLGDSKDEDDNDDDGESDDHDDDNDDERTESDSDEIPDPNLTNVD
nr:hypothetical protein [Tanacetum cinerariifolium]